MYLYIMGKTISLSILLLLAMAILVLIYTFQPERKLDYGTEYIVCGNSFDGNAPGEKTFKANCASCHKMNAKLIGPALAGVGERWQAAGDYQDIPSKEWLRRFIRNWQDPVEAGPPYALEIVKFDGSAMSAFPQLSDTDLDSLLMYLGVE